MDLSTRLALTRAAFAAAAQFAFKTYKKEDMSDIAIQSGIIAGSVFGADLLSRKVILPLEGHYTNKTGVRTFNQMLLEPLLAAGIATGYNMQVNKRPLDYMLIARVAGYDLAGGYIARFAGVGMSDGKKL